MSKLHRDNAGYIGCSHEETQDPYYSYNKLSLPLSDAKETVNRTEKTFAVTVQQVLSANKYFIDGVQQAALSLKQGEVYTFDLSDTSVATHPFKIRKVVNTVANSLTSGLPSGYSATTPSQHSGTVSDIETDNTSSLYATNTHIDFDLGAVKTIHSFKAVFTSNDTSVHSADYRIELYSDAGFTTLVAASDTAVSERITDIKTIDHDFGGVQARYVRWSYTGGGRTSYLRYFYPYADTSDVVLTTSGTQGQSGATAKYIVPFGTLGSYEYYCSSHAGMGANVSVSANAGMFTGALPVLNTSDQFGASLASQQSILFGYDNSDNSFDSSATSLTKDTTGYTFNAWSGSVLESSLGGSGANSAQVVKASDGSSVTWVVSTDSTDRKLWTSSNGVNWTSSGSNYDTDGSSVAITSIWLAWAGGANVSTTYVAISPEVASDPYAANLVLALPLNGGSTVDVSNSFNSSSTTKVFTTTGSITSNSSHTYYGSSADFNGSSRLGTTTLSYDFRFERNDFTIEYWATYDDISAGNSQVGDFQSSQTSGGITTSYTEGIHNSFYPAGQLNFSIDSNTCGSISGISTGTWYHIACVRENGVVRLYKNGILQSTVNNGGSIESTYMCVGGYYNNSYQRNGLMQDFRVYKGVAKYKANFSPVSRLSVTDQSSSAHTVTNNGASFQTSVKKFYDGAASFSGGSSVVIPASSDLQFGIGDFTIEGWMHPTSYGVTYPSVISKFDNGDASWIIRLHNSGQVIWYSGNGNNNSSASGLSLVNSWNHISAIRNSGVVTVYLNGSQILSVADTHDYNDSNAIYCGSQDVSNVNGFEGYLQDWSIYKGIAKYTSSFSPPERSIQGTARRYPSGVYVVS
jgi:hypothetical protein